MDSGQRDPVRPSGLWKYAQHCQSWSGHSWKCRPSLDVGAPVCGGQETRRGGLITELLPPQGDPLSRLPHPQAPASSGHHMADSGSWAAAGKVLGLYPRALSSQGCLDLPSSPRSQESQTLKWGHLEPQMLAQENGPKVEGGGREGRQGSPQDTAP